MENALVKASALRAKVGLFIDRLFFRGERWWAHGRTLCSAHQIGPMRICHEVGTTNCRTAERIARAVGVLWPLVEQRFPGSPVCGRWFTLFIVYEPRRGPGFHWGNEIVLNLAMGSDFLKVLGALAHELTHLRRWQLGISVERIFNIPTGLADHGEIVRFYAVNLEEYLALRCEVELVGTNADLLKEVERYWRDHGIGGD